MRKINEPTIIYVLETSKGNIYSDKCFIKFDKANHAKSIHESNNNIELSIRAFEVSFVGRYALYIHMYYGFDYTYSSGGKKMYDVVRDSTSLYPCRDHARNDPMWLGYQKKVASEPSKYNHYPMLICPKDPSGNDWLHGDVMEGKFNVSIQKLRVVA